MGRGRCELINYFPWPYGDRMLFSCKVITKTDKTVRSPSDLNLNQVCLIDTIK